MMNPIFRKTIEKIFSATETRQQPNAVGEGREAKTRSKNTADADKPVTYEISDFDNDSKYQATAISSTVLARTMKLNQMKKIRCSADFFDNKALKNAGLRMSFSYGYDQSADRFYAQARFMEDFEDDYSKAVFFEYPFCCYAELSTPQLRTYFSWRTKARRGVVEKTAISYFFLYVFELLNGVGAKNHADAFDKIVRLWQNCSVFMINNYSQEELLGLVNRYVRVWLKDFYLCNNFEIPFAELIKNAGIASHYPEVFEAPINTDICACLFRIADHRPEKSKFVIANPGFLAVIERCFSDIIKELDEMFKKNNFVIEGIANASADRRQYFPFNRALYRERHMPGKTVKIGENEYYTYQENYGWQKSVIGNEHCHRVYCLFFGYILKKLESEFQILATKKSRLSPDSETVFEKMAAIKSVTKRALAVFKRMLKSPVLDATIARNAARCFNAMPSSLRVVPPNKKTAQSSASAAQSGVTIEINIDFDKLDTIRSDADEIRDKLIAEETPPANVAFDIGGSKKNVEITAKTAEPKLAPPNGGDMRSAFLASLSKGELDALRVILSEQNVAATVRELAGAHGLMPEVLLEGINDKALEYVGDTVIDTTSEPVRVYEEYKRGLLKLLADCLQRG